MSEVLLLSIIALLVAILFLNAYLYDKTLKEIHIPRTEFEQELAELKATIQIARAQYREHEVEESHNESPSSDPFDSLKRRL